jgi:hypothetical protein
MESQPEVIYQVTLPSGIVVTSPHEFGLPHGELGPTGPIVTLDGRVLSPAPPPSEQPEDELPVADETETH